MCGILGYFTKNRGVNDALYLKKLVRQSRIRGLHSFGMSYVEGGELVVKKYFYDEYPKLTIPETDILIFHNRYSTSGDFQEHRNNQPILISQSAMCFNGVIDMGTKDEMQSRWGIEMETENDGEVVLKVSNYDPVRMLEFIQRHGSFSGLVLQNNTLHAMTNGYRPLWYWELGDSVFLASTKDIFVRAIPEAEPVPISVNTLYTWKK